MDNFKSSIARLLLGAYVLLVFHSMIPHVHNVEGLRFMPASAAEVAHEEMVIHHLGHDGENLPHPIIHVLSHLVDGMFHTGGGAADELHPSAHFSVLNSCFNPSGFSTIQEFIPFDPVSNVLPRPENALSYYGVLNNFHFHKRGPPSKLS